MLGTSTCLPLLRRSQNKDFILTRVISQISTLRFLSTSLKRYGLHTTRGQEAMFGEKAFDYGTDSDNLNNLNPFITES